MLRTRVITALLLLPPVLGVILFAPGWLLDVVLGLALAVMAWEFAALCGLYGTRRMLFTVVVVLLFAAAVAPFDVVPRLDAVLAFAAAWLWLLAPLWLGTRVALPAPMKIVLGIVLLAGAAVALHALKLAAPDGRWILMAFVIVWAADVGGYAAGRTWGRHKLLPAVSPGKTWEGFAGGVVLVLLVGVVAAYLFVNPHQWLAWLLLLALLAVISVIGDLVESLLKRQAGVKDSGTLLPGHGGLLDRLDSLLAVAPLFLLAGSRIGIFGELSSWGL